MAQKNTSGANSIPRLVVKIIGSKQVKQFIEEPRVDCRETSKTDGNPPVDGSDDGAQKAVMESRSQVQHRVDSALQAVINQVPDRLCVTAPSGDRSRSYIHPKTPHSSRPEAADELETTDQKGASVDGDKAELSSAVRDELSDWRLSSLRSTEDEVAALDLTFSGTLHRSEITHQFLKNDVPLRLPTLSLLLHMFSDEDDPVQVRYRDLLQFIRSSAFPEELHNDSELQSS